MASALSAAEGVLYHLAFFKFYTLDAADKEIFYPVCTYVSMYLAGSFRHPLRLMFRLVQLTLKTSEVEEISYVFFSLILCQC